MITLYTQTGTRNPSLTSKVTLILSFLLISLSFSHAQKKVEDEEKEKHTFVHPGMPWTIEDLDQMKILKNSSPWSTGWDTIMASKEASLDYKMTGPAVNEGAPNDHNLTNDGNAALYHALQWYFTRKEEHAKKAVGILEAYAATHRTWSGTAIHLHAAWRGGTLIRAAEILRYTYPGWTEENTANCEKYFIDVYWSLFRLPNPLRAANQGANNLWGAMQIAVFCNDQEKFQQCIEAYLNDPCGGISNTLPNGQCGDTGRDQGHAGAMIGNLSSAAEIAWSQGVDLYGALDNRLLTATEYWAKYNSGEEVEYINHGTSYGYYTSIGDHGRDPNSPDFVYLIEQVYAAYAIRKGIESPVLKKYRKTQPPVIDTFFFRKKKKYNTEAKPKGTPNREFKMEPVTRLSKKSIGEDTKTGTSRHKDGTWTLTGAGDKLYGREREDNFLYAFTKMKEDGAFIAKVVSIENVDPEKKGEIDAEAKASVVIRETLEPNSKMAALAGRPNSKNSEGARYSSRGAYVSDGSGNQKFPLAKLPIWIKIERRGESIVGYVGPDGKNWTPMHSSRFKMADEYFIGLGVASNKAEERCIATFTNVQKSVGFVEEKTNNTNKPRRATNKLESWTRVTDNKTIVASLVSYDKEADMVKLKLKNGNVVEIKASILIPEHISRLQKN